MPVAALPPPSSFLLWLLLPVCAGPPAVGTMARPPLRVGGAAQDDLQTLREREDRFLRALLRRPQPGATFDRWLLAALEGDRMAALLGEREGAARQAPGDLAAALLLGLLDERLGRSEDAARIFQKAAEAHPDSAMPCWLLGRIQQRRGEAALALQSWALALEREPPGAFADEIALALARLELRQGRRDEALARIEALRRRHAGDRHLVAELAELLADEGAAQEALDLWSEAIRRFPDDPYYVYQSSLEMARLHQALDQFGPALAAYERLLDRVDPESWQATELRRRVEEAFGTSGRSAEYLEHLRRRVRRQPEDLPHRLQLAQVLERSGQLEEAREVLENAVRVAPGRDKIHEARVDFARRHDDLDTARIRAREWVDARPGQPAALERLGRLHAERACDLTAGADERERGLRATLQAWHTLRDLDPRSAGLARRAAECFVDADRLWLVALATEFGIVEGGSPFAPQAEDCLREAVRRAPDALEHHEALGDFLLESGREDEALQAWWQLVDPPREDAEHHRLLYGILARRRPREALKAARIAIQLDPVDLAFRERSLSLRVQLVQTTDPVADLAELRADLQRFTALDDSVPHLDRGLELRVQLAVKLGRVEAELRAMAAQAPPDPLPPDQTANAERLASALLRAKLLLATGRAEEAALALQEARRLRPDSAELMESSAQLLIRLQRPLDALLQWQELVERQPRSQDLVVPQILALQLELGRDEEALRTAEGWTERRPDSVEAWTQRAEVNLRAGRDEEGLHLLARALRLSPEDLDLRRRYAQQLAEQDRPGEALEHLWRCYELETDLSRSRDLVRELVPLARRCDRVQALLERIRAREAVDDDKRRALCLYDALRIGRRQDEALVVLQRLQARLPDDLDVLQQLLQSAEDRGEVDTMAGLLERLAVVHDDPNILMRLARTRMALGDLPRAAMVWRSILRSPDGPGALLAEIDSLMRGDDPEGAWALCEVGREDCLEPWPFLDRALLLGCIGPPTQQAAPAEVEAVLAELAGTPLMPEVHGPAFGGPGSGLVPGSSLGDPLDAWTQAEVLIPDPLDPLAPPIEPLLVEAGAASSLGLPWLVAPGLPARDQMAPPARVRGWPMPGALALLHTLAEDLAFARSCRDHKPSASEATSLIAPDARRARSRALAVAAMRSWSEDARSFGAWLSAQNAGGDRDRRAELACVAWCFGMREQARELAAPLQREGEVLAQAFALFEAVLAVFHRRDESRPPSEGSAVAAMLPAVPALLEQADRALADWTQRRPQDAAALAERMVPVALALGEPARARSWLQRGLGQLEQVGLPPMQGLRQLAGLLGLAGAVHSMQDEELRVRYVQSLIRHTSEPQLDREAREAVCSALAGIVNGTEFPLLLEAMRPLLSAAALQREPAPALVAVDGARPGSPELAETLVRAGRYQPYRPDFPPPAAGLDLLDLLLLQRVSERARSLGLSARWIEFLDAARPADGAWGTAAARSIFARWWSGQNQEALELLCAAKAEGTAAAELVQLSVLACLAHGDLVRADALLRQSEGLTRPETRALQQHLDQLQDNGSLEQALAGLRLRLLTPSLDDRDLAAHVPDETRLRQAQAKAARRGAPRFDPRLVSMTSTPSERRVCIHPLPALLQRAEELAQLEDLAQAAETAAQGSTSSTLALLRAMIEIQRGDGAAAARHALVYLDRAGAEQASAPQLPANEWLWSGCLALPGSRELGLDRCWSQLCRAWQEHHPGSAGRLWRSLLRAQGADAVAELARVLQREPARGGDRHPPLLRRWLRREALVQFFEASPSPQQAALLPPFLVAIVDGEPATLSESQLFDWLPRKLQELGPPPTGAQQNALLDSLLQLCFPAGPQGALRQPADAPGRPGAEPPRAATLWASVASLAASLARSEERLPAATMGEDARRLAEIRRLGDSRQFEPAMALLAEGLAEGLTADPGESSDAGPSIGQPGDPARQAALLRERARLSASANLLERAAADLIEALRLDPLRLDFDTAWRLLLRASEQRGREVARAILAAPALASRGEPGFALASLVHWRLGLLPEAEALIAQACLRTPAADPGLVLTRAWIVRAARGADEAGPLVALGAFLVERRPMPLSFALGELRRRLLYSAK